MIQVHPGLFELFYKELSFITNEKKRCEEAESLAHDKMIQLIMDGDFTMIKWFLQTHRPEEWGKYNPQVIL